MPEGNGGDGRHRQFASIAALLHLENIGLENWWSGTGAALSSVCLTADEVPKGLDANFLPCWAELVGGITLVLFVHFLGGTPW